MSFLAASTLFTFSSCADDHFDINPDVNGVKTIWENIKENKDISDYAYILENVPFSQNENGMTKETYKDILNGDQTFTIWAPKNGSYDIEYYKSLIATGTEENLKKVERELIRNNMTRYTHIMNGKDSVKLELFNAKVGWLNFAKNTFKGQSILNRNIASSNGVLHITKAPAPFEPNLYEYISLRDDASMFKEFIMRNEEVRFDETASTEGPTVNGQATWVDSVTYKINSYLRGYHGALIEREDSNYVMVLPTDKALSDKYDKVKSLFNYKKKYEQQVIVTTDGKDTWTKSGEDNILEDEMDSIINFRTMNALCQGIIYNANWQPRQINISSLEALSKADSIVSTYGHKFKKTGTLNKTNNLRNTHESDDFGKMFGGNAPIACSNGNVFVSDSWNFPSTLWAPTLELNPMVYIDCIDNKTQYSTGRETYNFYTENGNDSIVSYQYLQVESSKSSANFTAYFDLGNVLSCKYDIYLVTLHNNSTNKPTYLKFRIHKDIKENQKWNDGWDDAIENTFQDGLDSYGKDVSSKPANFYTHQAQIDTVSTSPIKIKCESLTDTICIAKDYEFPFSYYGLENCHPLLEMKSGPTNTEAKNGYCREARIVSLILKPKREE